MGGTDLRDEDLFDHFKFKEFPYGVLGNAAAGLVYFITGTWH